MKKIIVFLCLFLCVGAIVFVLMNRYQHKKSVSNQVQTAEIIAVSAYEATRSTLKEELRYTGTLECANLVPVISQTSGTIERMIMTVGMHCRKGDTLAVVASSMQEAAFEQAQAQVLAAQTNYQKTLKDLQRIEKLHADTIATQYDLENMQLSVKAALAQLKSSQAGLKVAEKQFDDTYIRAPINGTIATRHANIGVTVAPGAQLAIIVDDSQFKLKILVSELDIAKIKKGQEVAISVDAFADRRFTGSIQTISGLPSEQGRSYPVEVIIDGKQYSELKTGMFCRASISTRIIPDALIIPEQAVQMGVNETTFVYIVENEYAVQTPVTLGVKYENNYEVLAGLRQGSRVVVAGKERLKSRRSRVETVEARR
ncbi:MAG: efflux RND transporter periplasmic adaptor subunit [Chitinivibrionales bacterium]|nr:efflux RND transporter periplasmic adaptor subunit [Chitinivibrionales bacterium]